MRAAAQESFFRSDKRRSPKRTRAAYQLIFSQDSRQRGLLIRVPRPRFAPDLLNLS